MHKNELLGSQLGRPFHRFHVRQIREDAVQEIGICATRHQHELLVKELEDTWLSWILNHIDRVLVVLEGDARPLDTLCLVLLLLQREHMLIELLLQLFVGVVNAELFERILSEHLEAEDIEQTNESQLGLSRTFLTRSFRFFLLRICSR